MIELNTGPAAGGDMTAVALRGCLNMISGFTGGGHPVMAGGAGTGDAVVIESHTGPTAGGGMAIVALGSGGNMAARLAGRTDPVMATGTGAGQVCMVNANG